MSNQTKKSLPIAVSVIGLLIAGYGSYQQGKGNGGTLVWVGIGIVFIGVLLSTAAAQKPKA